MVDPGFYLRAGESGALVEGTPGNVLTFQTDGKLKGEAPAAGGSVLPLSNVFIVDKNTTSTAQDGSFANPFNTVQEALDAAALAPGDNVAVLVCPGDYLSEGALTFSAGSKLLQLSALQQTSQGFNGNSLPRIGALTCTGSFVGVSLRGVTHGSVDGGFGSVRLQDCSMLNGTVTCDGGVVSGVSCWFNTGCALAGANIRLQTCEIQSVTMTVAGTLVEVTGSMWTVGAAIEFVGNAGDVRLDSLSDFYFTAMGGAATITNGAVVQLF